MSTYDPKATYIPILKAKSGELSALGELANLTSKKVIPLLEIPRPQWDFVNEAPLETSAQLLSRIIPLIEKNWGKRPFFLDVYKDPLLSPKEKDTDLVDVFATSLNDKELNYIPVISFDYSRSYNKSIVEKLSNTTTGCALRVTISPDDSFEEDDYNTLLKDVGLEPSQVDLILDLGSVYRDGAEAVYLAYRLILAETPHIKAWRNLIIAASSFPKGVGSLVEVNGNKRFPRSEWLGWTKLASYKKLSRLPIFADYSVSHPEVFDDVDPRHMKLSGAIRYTTADEWLIVKGERLTGKGSKGYDQFHELAKKLVDSGYFRENASWGDKFILDCSNPEGSVGTGNLTTWRKVGNSQHIEFVIQQLAKISENA